MSKLVTVGTASRGYQPEKVLNAKVFEETHLAVASALVETPEAFALDRRHAVPIMDEIAQIDPGLAWADVARQQVAFARLESYPAGSVVRWRQDASVRQGLTAGFGHLELLLDANLVGSRPFRPVVNDALDVSQNNCQPKVQVVIILKIFIFRVEFLPKSAEQ